jgi:predicted NAD/FAD-dependent oxidoreductase
VKERRATVRLTPGLARPAPGPVAGMPGLFLCGDYTGTGLPATVEGAVASGEAAAAAVLAA